MRNNIIKNRILLMLVVVVMVLSAISQDAYAWGGGRYYYHGGRWYNNGWFWLGAGATALALGAIVASLPPHYGTVYYEGAPYYYYDGIYYRPCPSGYVVVQAPPAPGQVFVQQPVTAAQPVASAPVQNVNVAQEPAPSAQGEPFTVNVPNYKGGYTPVTLTRSGSGFIGPQGEYYKEFPKIKQLKEMYGK